MNPVPRIPQQVSFCTLSECNLSPSVYVEQGPRYTALFGASVTRGDESFLSSSTNIRLQMQFVFRQQAAVMNLSEVPRSARTVESVSPSLFAHFKSRLRFIHFGNSSPY